MDVTRNFWTETVVLNSQLDANFTKYINLHTSVEIHQWEPNFNMITQIGTIREEDIEENISIVTMKINKEMD